MRLIGAREAEEALVVCIPRGSVADAAEAKTSLKE
jgi:hypothetical protein